MGALRLLGGLLVVVAFFAAWLAAIWLVMLVVLYIVRTVPLRGRGDGPRGTA